MSFDFVTPVLPDIGANLEMREVSIEEPREGEVMVEMVASGVCHSCLHAMDGSHGGTPTPLVLGDEGAGIVEAVGPGVTDVSVGDHVVISWAPSCGRCRFCVSGRPVLCERGAPPGRLRDGTTRLSIDGAPLYHFGPATYAAHTVVDASAAIPIRRDLPLDTAALIGCAVATGVGAVVNTSGASFGSSVAVFGCGGVGLNAIQGTRLIGAHPIVAVDLVEERLDLAEQLGATHSVMANSSSADEELSDVSGGGFDATILAVGAISAFEQAWTATGRGGTCVVVGRTPDGESVSFNPQTIHTGARRLAGSIYGAMRPSVDFPKLADLAFDGRLALDELVTKRYPIDQANEAFEDLAGGQLARGLLVF